MIKEIITGRMNNGRVAICKCDYCGKEIKKKISDISKTKHQFCNDECFLKFAKENKSYVKVICDNCGKKFDKRKYEIERCSHNFCNSQCYFDYRRKKNELRKREVKKLGYQKCIVCGKIKPISEFYKDKCNTTGYRNQCKDCKLKKDTEYYVENINQIKKIRKKFYETNKERLSKENKEWRDKNREWIEKYTKKYYRDNFSKIKAQAEKYKPRKNMLWRERYKNDIRFKISNKISSLISRSINDKGRCRWEDLVGYTLEDLKKHLENQFKEGMNWDNYTYYGWHIDHKIPVKFFNFKSYKDTEFKLCWCLGNLQPLWAEENLNKSSKLNYRYIKDIELVNKVA